MQPMTITTLTALLSLLLFTGCVHLPAPHLPQSWNGTVADDRALIDPPNQAQLQIIIAYGQLVENHAALRLVSPGRQALFWDPGGGYNKQTAPHTRWNDLIVQDPPDLKTYLAFRRTRFDSAVEVFEWIITAEQAEELYDVLQNGRDASDPSGAFRTSTMGLFCSVAISDFLNRFAGDILTVSDTYFWPNELAKVLYTQSPNRVIMIRPDNPLVIYQPPPADLQVSSPAADPNSH